MKIILTSLITAGSLILFAADAKADGETWRKVGDPNDTYVNKRHPANGRVTGLLTNGSDIWVTQARQKLTTKSGDRLLYSETTEAAITTMY